MIEVPLWKKITLSIEEAASYSGIGINKLRTLTKYEDCPFVIWLGGKRRIKREKLEEFINDTFSL